MATPTIGRDKIRKKPLEHFCYKAETVRDGQDKREVYCRGLGRPECHYCAACHELEWYQTEAWYLK